MLVAVWPGRPAARMDMPLRVNFGRNQVQLAVPHATLCDQGVGEGPYLLGAPSQDHRFHALLVIEVGVHRGYGEVVVLVLQVGRRSARSRSW